LEFRAGASSANLLTGVLAKALQQSGQTKQRFNWTADILAAVGERLYAVLAGGLVAFDAASGAVVRDYKVSPDGFVYHKGGLILWGKEPVCALDAETGEVRWRSAVRGVRAVVGDGRVFVAAARSGTAALDFASGRTLWESRLGGGMIYHDGVLAVTNKKTASFHGLSAKDGKLLWTRRSYEDGHSRRLDTFFTGGLVWLQAQAERPVVGLDPLTGGEMKRLAFAPGLQIFGRCAPPAASQRFMITAARFILDWRNGKTDRLPTARAVCRLGFRIANGMVYQCPRNLTCSCYPSVQNAFSAFAPLGQPAAEPPDSMEDRLQRGPAYGKVKLRQRPAADVALPSELRRIWQVSVAGPPSRGLAVPTVYRDSNAPGAITRPVVDGDTVYVALPNAHQVHALDARTGRPRWRYTAGARVASSPTIYNGLCLFGSRNGWVHCLRASDGQLVWRFRAARRQRWIVSSGQVESAWPV
ncbi:hypothetical protein LCGC14_2583700, partial [marine sediment metagenome]